MLPLFAENADHNGGSFVCDLSDPTERSLLSTNRTCIYFQHVRNIYKCSTCFKGNPSKPKASAVYSPILPAHKAVISENKPQKERKCQSHAHINDGSLSGILLKITK